MDTVENRLDKIEIKLAYIEDFVGRLQEDFVERNQSLDRLKTEQKAIREKLVSLSQQVEDMPDQKPPHY